MINKVEISSVNTSQLPILTNKEKEELNNMLNEYNDLKDVYDENRILKEKLDSYVNVESENEVLQSEIKKLKKKKKVRKRKKTLIKQKKRTLRKKRRRKKRRKQKKRQIIIYFRIAVKESWQTVK